MWFLVEHDCIRISYNTGEKDFYYRIFQRYITCEGESIHIAFPVPIGSAKKS